MGLPYSCFKEVFGATSHYESYAFEVVQDHGEWQLRRYLPAVAAETDAGADKQSEGRAFQRLAKYIGVFSAPENVENGAVPMTTPVVSKPIAMTTPVVSQPITMTSPVVSSDAGGSTTMRFVLPSIYKCVEDAPQPTNAKVRIVATPPMDMAAITFSGSLQRTEDAHEKFEELLDHIQGSGFSVDGPWELHRHNPPYTIPALRTNEVVVPVRRAT